MHFILPVFLFLINLSLTLAVIPSNANNSTANTTFTPPSRYYLKTSVIDGGNADKNDLYVSSYHTGPLPSLSSINSPSSNATHIASSNSTTGAGLGDATLIPFSTTGTVGFLNATHQQFDLHSSVPVAMIMEPSENLDVCSFLPSSIPRYGLVTVD